MWLGLSDAATEAGSSRTSANWLWANPDVSTAFVLSTTVTTGNAFWASGEPNN
jgi:hypothetical protein